MIWRLRRLDGVTPLGKSLLILSEGRKDRLAIAALIVDINGPSTAPAHDLTAKSFSFTQIRLGIKMVCAQPTLDFEPDEVFGHEQMPEIVRGETHRALALQGRVVPIPMVVKRFG